MPTEKPEIFSGFLRLSTFSSLFWNSDFSANKKMPIGVLVLRTRNEPLWHLPWSRCHSYIRLRRVLLLRSGIRLSPSDIRYASLRGEYNITATTELQNNSEQYHCCLQQYHADTVSISLPIWYCICVYKCSACQEKRTENVKHSLSFSCQFEYTALWQAPLPIPF